ncbi:MAG: hypothetical protein M9924_03835 [Rhizobiaceae bacterium]|nr:hypothetical protein [Rhizobiaceae bacterium]
MISESARVTTAEEAAYRIDAPNSLPRAIKVIALDKRSGNTVNQLARSGWKNTLFFVDVAVAWDPKTPRGTPIEASLVALDGGRRDIGEEVATANLIVIVVSAGNHSDAVPLIAEACQRNRVMITGLLLGAGNISDAQMMASLKTLRPYAPMLVVSSEDDYIAAMLTALRA